MRRLFTLSATIACLSVLSACGGTSSAPAAPDSPAAAAPPASQPALPPASQTQPAPAVDPAPAADPVSPAPPPPTSLCDPLDKRVRTSTLTVGGSVSRSDEYTPALVAARPDGTSVLAWTDPGAGSIRMAALTPADALDRALPGLVGLEAHAMLPLPQGMALAVMDSDADIYSSKYCRGPGTPTNAVCGKMDLVQLDADGTVLSRTTLTKKQNVDSVGAQFIWWYGHTARLATDGSKIGVYYRSAMSTARPGVAGEVDIHAGDTLKFVDAQSGALLAGGWDWGCSHSWSVRLGHNGRQWAAACHGDAYPNAMQVARFNGTAAVGNLRWLDETDPARRALGGLVPATSGHWLNYIADNAGTLVLKLAQVSESGSTLTLDSVVSGATQLDSVYPMRPYMAAYGTGKLLLGWKAGGKLVLATADAATGAVTEGPIVTSLAIDNFQEMVSAPNGDVIWAHSEGSSSIAVNRVAACRLTP